ncbi:MAG: TM2 domain-containing protein [Pseudomonadota bacterium]
MSFGRKGLQPGQAAQQPARGVQKTHSSQAIERDIMIAKREAALIEERLRKVPYMTSSQLIAAGQNEWQSAGDTQPISDEDMAAKRAAFIASERQRKRDEEIGQGSLPDANGEYSSDPMAQLRNDARPAKPLANHQQPADDVMYRPSQQSYRSTGISAGSRSRSSGKSGFIFGEPAGRSVGLAYVLWFILGQASIHRFYCGQAESAWFQLSLFIGSLVTLFVLPMIGIVGFIAWVMWIVADLFLIPGMMRRFKAENSSHHVFA